MDKKENEILTVDVCMKYIAAKNVFTSRRHHTKPNHSDILVKTSYTQNCPGIRPAVKDSRTDYFKQDIMD